MVRHGQGSFHDHDYDQLSARGQEQARRLGAHWAGSRVVFDHVFVGPRRRHRQTLDSLAAAYREQGLPWPQAVELPELDEHSGQHLLHRTLPEAFGQNTSNGALAFDSASPEEMPAPDYLKRFQELTRIWVQRKVEMADLESWQDFRKRVHGAIERMISTAGRKSTVVAFTSGGPIAAAVGMALNLGDEQTLELSWMIRNTGYAEFLFSQGRFSLAAFNTHPHLAGSDLLTHI